MYHLNIFSKTMIFDLFSKRQKRLRGEFPDVYQYDKIPNPLRAQVVHIMNDAMGDSRCNKTIGVFKFIHDTLCREYGKFRLYEDETYTTYIDFVEEVKKIILGHGDVEHVIDAIEISFLYIDTYYRQAQIAHLTQSKITPEDAIEELNERFQEDGVGYQYESGKMIRVDTQLIHSEAVKPVLQLLSCPRFKGANEEFLRSHEHYRHARYKDCISTCLRAFESTMKIICDEQGWCYDRKDTAKQLINICFQNHLIPPYLQTQFSSLQQNLESGIPTVRNNNSGHGQGSQQVLVPQYFAAYQLHLTASTILFLVEAEKTL